MKEYLLNYYSGFKCIAGACEHTCCAGWEMCIDKESLDAYKKENSGFATTLANGINFKKSKFKSDKFGRCAFLDANGLCEIISNLGENALCQVCRDHPRFRSFFGDRVETGLGFCCEEATRIILSSKDKIQPVLVKDDGVDNQLDFTDENLLEFRAKVLKIVQDRSLPIDDRVVALLKACNANITELNFKKIVKLFLSFERLDKGWTKRLKGLKIKPFSINTKESLALYCEQFLANELYRHLSSAEDTMWVRARGIACVLSWLIINNVIAETEDFSEIIDVVRAYSAEVEYSEKNLNKLFVFAYEFIKI